VEDLLTLVPRKWAVHMKSDSPAFGSSCSIPSLSFGVISLGVADHFPCVLSKSMTLVLFRTSTLFNQDHINDLQLPSRSRIEILLRDFGASTLYFPQKYSVPGVLDLAPHVHLRSMTLIRLGNSAFENLKPKILLACFFQNVLSRVHNLMTCVLLQITDSQLLWLFGLRRFQTLLLRVLPK
jgi:hypothetical protein